MLEKYFSDSWIYYDKATNELKGYFLPSMGEGPVIATDREAGLSLLKFKHSLKECEKAVLPKENKDGKASPDCKNCKNDSCGFKKD